MLMRTMLSTILVGLMVSVSAPAIAQEASPSARQEENAAKQPVKPAVTYRLDFAINELENGKKINTRRYSQIQVEDYQFRGLKIGSRVPVATGDAQFQYIDVGTNISTKLYPQANELMLDVKAEISNIAGAGEESQSSHPIVRQMVIAGSMTLIPGKPLVIGSVDDPSSTHTFQLEVTATKL
jgi:hypothetical protein